MSTHTYAVPGESVIAAQVAAMFVRAPTSVTYSERTLTLTYAPDLDAPTTTLVDGAVADVLAGRRASRTGLTLEEYRALKGALADLRAFRTQSAAEFSALTAAQRDAALRTALFGAIDVLRAIVRD